MQYVPVFTVPSSNLGLLPLATWRARLFSITVSGHIFSKVYNGELDKSCQHSELDTPLHALDRKPEATGTDVPGQVGGNISNPCNTFFFFFTILNAAAEWGKNKKTDKMLIKEVFFILSFVLVKFIEN